jgi:hypothetical protein
MSLSAYRVARNDMRALRRQTLAKVFRPGMTAIEASHALAMELGYSFTDTTIHSDLKALGLTPVSGTERVRAMTKARRLEVQKAVLAGESVQSLAERLKALAGRFRLPPDQHRHHRCARDHHWTVLRRLLARRGLGLGAAWLEQGHSPQAGAPRLGVDPDRQRSAGVAHRLPVIHSCAAGGFFSR